MVSPPPDTVDAGPIADSKAPPRRTHLVANQPRFGFVVEYVDDVVSAKSFYTDVLGLTIDRESPNFIQFSDPAGVHHAIASDESLSGGSDPEMYWVVDDAAAL